MIFSVFTLIVNQFVVNCFFFLEVRNASVLDKPVILEVGLGNMAKKKIYFQLILRFTILIDFFSV